MTDIEISYTVTPDEYVESQILYQQKKQRKQLMMIWVLPTIFLISLTLILLTNPTFSSASIFPALIAGTVVSICFALASPLLRRRAFRKRFVIEAPNMTDVRACISSDGFSSKTTGIGTGFAEWSGFDSWVEDKKVFVLFRGFTFQPIPKRVLASTQIEELRILLSEKIQTKH
jgi:hypothetical protein